MSNHLSQENSPYLLQHADNPVDWYPWGEEALTRARQEDKPIFLSIGYAACHWCHVMAHESFEDVNIARFLNTHFINIKVDREERPDLDTVYMNAVVSIAGGGGWPMSLFLTPDGKPFFGGTYFPPVPRHGMPAFSQVLESVVQSWHVERSSIEEMGQRLIEHISSSVKWKMAEFPLQAGILDKAEETLLSTYDWQDGGWGKAPKFPQAMALDFLLFRSTRAETSNLKTACHALDAMSQGGIFDLVGGGFHRYSTDTNWLVPHFEKMLYDNALLASAYLHAFLITKNTHYRQVCEQTLDFILREMTHPLGGFYSSLDADTNGEEGLTYTWNYSDLSEVIKSDFQLFIEAYSLTQQGNFEGKIILKRALGDQELAERTATSIKAVEDKLTNGLNELLLVRKLRPQPGVDDKILTGWNGLALKALAEAARYLGREDYLAAARKNADFLLQNMFDGNTLHRSWRNGKAQQKAALEDYTSLAIGLIFLYQASPEDRWYQAAEKLVDGVVEHFYDVDGGYFDSQADPSLPMRPKEYQDNATPSGNAMAAHLFLLLSDFSVSQEHRDRAEDLLGPIQKAASEYPTAFSYWLQAMDYAAGPISQIALLGNSKDIEPYLDVLREHFDPRRIVASSPYPPPTSSPPLLYDRPLQQGRATAYVCWGFVCNLPVNTTEAFKQQVENPSESG